MFERLTNKFQENKTFCLISLTVLSAIVLKNITRSLISKWKERKWQAVADKTRLERDLQIAKFLKENLEKISQKRINEIVAQDLETLSMNIKKQNISSEEAVLAYIIRAATVGKDLNLIANINFEEALKDAKLADELIKNCKDISTLPALIGVPVSIKDHITVKNVKISAGYASHHSLVRDYDSYIVEVLRSKGAIPFVVSNVPQGVCSIESSNYVWGNAMNPWNKTKSVGGSSGGEGGLISSRCSPFGIGSDLGGSIRIPSAFCGLYGLKPTSLRISKNGIYAWGSEHVGLQSIPITLGPLCRSANDLILVAKNILGNFTEDPYCDNTLFNDEILNSKSEKKLKIGYLTDLKGVNSSPDAKAKLNLVLEKLKEDGHEAVEFEFKEMQELLDLCFDILFNCYVINDIVKVAEGEKLQKYNSMSMDLLTTPLWMIRLLSKVFYVMGEKHVSDQLSKYKRMNTRQYVEANKNFSELKSKFIAYFKSEKFDCLVCPSFSCPAFDIGKGGDFLGAGGFHLIFNAIDMPCVNIPIGLCDDISYVKRSNEILDNFVNDNMKTSKGMPVSILLGCLPKEEEKCLRIMKEIDNHFRFDLNHSHKVMEILHPEEKKNN